MTGAASAPSPLSRPVCDIAPHYDTLVVGSGYGGAVSACRLSAGLPGESLAVFEAGREWPPASLPDATRGLLPSLLHSRCQFSARLPTVGSPSALFDVTVSTTTSIVHGRGLGGGSLVNAAVVAWPEDRVLLSDSWPSEFREDALTFCSRDRAAAREMLRPALYPHLHSKSRIVAVKDAGASAGYALRDAELAINMSDEHVHPISGVVQDGCIGCGNCCGGCCIGAKNTLTVNYLPVAAQHGAHIFTEVEVRAIQTVSEQRHGRLGYLVHFDYPQLAGAQLLPRGSGVVHASRVVLAAGVVGTFKILAESQARFGLPVSPALGSRFSANGASWQLMREVEAGRGLPVAEARCLPHAHRPGPSISHTLDARSSPRTADSVHMQPATAPLLADRLLQLGQVMGGRWTDLRFALPRYLRSPPLSLLSEGHDSGSGRLRYHAQNGAVQVEWPDIGHEPFVTRAQEVGELVARAWGVERYLGWRPIVPRTDPRSASSKHVIITHALGGAVMADSGAKGVVNHRSQVFTGAGTDVLCGLFVIDASVVPSSLSTNPLLLITALAERACRLLIADSTQRMAAQCEASDGLVQLHSRHRPSSRRRDGYRLSALSDQPSPPPSACSVRFTERMAGFVNLTTPDNCPDSLTSPAVGCCSVASHLIRSAFPGADNRQRSALELILTLEIAAASGSESTTRLAGRVLPGGRLCCPELFPFPLVVIGGEFSFSRNLDRDGGEMLYTVDVSDSRNPTQWQSNSSPRWRAPSTFRITGRKELQPRGWMPALSAWRDTTTLSFRMEDKEKALMASGTLRIAFSDLLKQSLSLLTATDVRTQVLPFLRHFFALLVRIYTRLPTRLPFGFVTARRVRDGRELIRKAHEVPTADQHRVRVTRWSLNSAQLDGGEQQQRSAVPVVLVHGGSPGAGQQLFAHLYSDQNAVEYLLQQGHDVWTLDWRFNPEVNPALDTIGATLSAAAAYDIPAGVEAICRLTAQPRASILAHCLGGYVVMQSLAGGHLSGARLHKLLLNQFTHRSRPGWLNAIKCWLPVVPLLVGLLGLRVLPANRNGSWWETLLLQPLCTASFFLTQPRSEWCLHAGCHRTTFCYGRLYSHRRLTANVHAAVHGGILGDHILRPFEEMAQVFRRALVQQQQSAVHWGEDGRLQYDVLILSSTANAVNSSDSARSSYDELVQAAKHTVTAAGQQPEITLALLHDLNHLDVLLAKDAATSIWPMIHDFFSSHPLTAGRDSGRLTIVSNRSSEQSAAVLETADSRPLGLLQNLLSALLVLVQLLASLLLVSPWPTDPAISASVLTSPPIPPVSPTSQRRDENLQWTARMPRSKAALSA